jgi:hypothetical protein
VLRAAHDRPDHVGLEVRTDSRYVMSCTSGVGGADAGRDNVDKWRSNGWVTSRGTAVANRDLVERLADLDIELRHVKGHRSRGNRAADVSCALGELTAGSRTCWGCRIGLCQVRAGRTGRQQRGARVPEWPVPEWSSRTRRGLPEREGVPGPSSRRRGGLSHRGRPAPPRRRVRLGPLRQ